MKDVLIIVILLTLIVKKLLLLTIINFFINIDKLNNYKYKKVCSCPDTSSDTSNNGGQQGDQCSL